MQNINLKGEVDMIDVNIEINDCPKDDFYLQWCYIYQWQVKINLEIMVVKAMKMNKELEGKSVPDKNGYRWRFHNGRFYGMCLIDPIKE